MAEHHPEPTPFPNSPDFPFEWVSPEDVNLPWMHERQHAPGPVTPLSGWLIMNYWGDGACAGMAAAGQPMGIRYTQLNTLLYVALFPTAPPEQMEEAASMPRSR
jgi:hypothetical protein